MNQPEKEKDSELASLRKERDELQKRLEVAGDQLLDAQLDLVTAAQEKNEFLATMAHEIRTPLNGIIGATDLLVEAHNPAEQKQLMEILRTCGEVLLALVNDILDISKLESQRLQLETQPFDLRRAVLDVVNVVAPRAREKGLSFKCQVDDAAPQIVEGDLVRFRQILVNLAGNAVKFTATGSIDLHIKVKSRAGDDFVIETSVADTGIGVKKEDQSKLFQKYSQADTSTTRLFGGTGLGLAICKALSEKMNGGIDFESEPGKGSTFHFWIRLKQVFDVVPINAEHSPGKSPSHGKNAPLKILVVEDIEVNRTIISRLLGRLGYHAELAVDGVDAMDKVQATAFDVIFMDLSMPRMDGVDTTRLIRHSVPAERQPFICALTGHATNHEKERCVSAGMNAYLTKPVRMDDLTKVLGKVKSLAPALTLVPQESAVPNATPPASSEAKDVPSVDPEALHYLRELTEPGQADFLDQIIGEFTTVSRTIFENLVASVKSGDLRGVQREGHKLKGCAQNLKLGRLAGLCREFEECQDASSPFLAGRLDEMGQELEKVSRELNTKWKTAA